MSSEETDKIREKLLQIYARRYQKPEWVLNHYVDELVKEGKTREEAILHLYQEQTKKETPKQTSEHDFAAERQIETLKEKISRLAVLFSQGEISEESYKSSVKAIEENIDKLRRGKEIPTRREPTLPSVSQEYESRWEERGGPTGLWWLVPFLFGIIGGIVAYIGVRDDDEEMASGLLIFGIIWTVILGIIGWLLIFH